MRRVVLLAALLVACADQPPPQQGVAQLGDSAAGDAPAEPAEPSPTGPGPAISVEPIELSPLYKGFVTDPAATGKLTEALASVAHARLVRVQVSWDEARKVGSMTLLMPEEERVGAPLARALIGDQPLDAGRLQPWLKALGSWRAELGNRFDLRLLAFQTRLGFWDPSTGSRCYLDGAAGDPSGATVGSCFQCLDPRTGQMLPLCREGDSWPAKVEGDKKARRMLSSAFKGQ